MRRDQLKSVYASTAASGWRSVALRTYCRPQTSLLVLGLGLSLVAGGRTAHAQQEAEASRAPEPAPEVIGQELVVSAQIACHPDDCETLRHAVEGSLSRMEIQARIELAPSFQPVDVVAPTNERKSLTAIWIDALQPGQLSLYIVDYRSDHVYLRRLPLESGIDSVVSDLLELILDSSLRAIREGQKLGISRERFAQKVMPPPPPVERARVAPKAPEANFMPRTHGVALGGGYGAVLRNDSLLSTGPLALLGYRWEGGAVFVEGGYLLPATVHGADLFAEISAWDLRVLTTWTIELSNELRWGLVAGFGSEWTSVLPIARTEAAEARAAFWTWEPSLVMGGVMCLSSGRWQFSTALRGELPFVDTRYEVEADGQRTTVYSPWAVRPMLALKVGLRL